MFYIIQEEQEVYRNSIIGLEKKKERRKENTGMQKTKRETKTN